jgi:deoxyribonuclease-4
VCWQLRAIIDLVEEKDRMGVCVDTCHIFAAGYDISTERGWEITFREFDEVLDLSRLVAFHVNDSKRELGSHVDRHEHIGKGKIGLEGFRLLMNDPRFKNIPKILETPKSAQKTSTMKTINPPAVPSQPEDFDFISSRVKFQPLDNTHHSPYLTGEVSDA